MHKLALIAKIGTVPSCNAAYTLTQLHRAATWVEIAHHDFSEADLQRRLCVADGRRTIFTARGLDQQSRHRNLQRAADHFDLVELDYDHDLTPALLQRIPIQRRIITWTGSVDSMDSLRQRLTRARRYGAVYYKFIIQARDIGDCVFTLRLVKEQSKHDVLAYSTGSSQLWTSVLAAFLGAPLIYGTAIDKPADHQPTIARLVDDYAMPQRYPIEFVNGIVGGQVDHSRSPRMHNARYRQSQFPAVYLPFSIEDFHLFWDKVVGAGTQRLLGWQFGGFTVASPFKREALAVADQQAATTRLSRSANLLKRSANGWLADTTDPAGVLDNLRKHEVSITQRAIAVIGCGGSGRAIAASLQQLGGNVTLVNRGAERRNNAMRLLSLPGLPLNTFRPREFDIVINATPAGKNDDELPFELSELHQQAIVIDLPYGAEPTRLSRLSRAAGHLTIDGLHILQAQVNRQEEALMDQGGMISTTDDNNYRLVKAANYS